MAKGGRVIVEKSRRGISRWKGDEEDEEDEEYIAEEEEELESESYDEFLASSSDSEDDGGGEFGGNLEEFSGSDRSFEEDSDFEFDDSEFEEEEEIRAKSSKKGRKKSGKKQTKARRKVSDSDEDDEDFDIKSVPNKNRRKQSRKDDSEGSDYEEEEEDDFDDLDEDEDFTPDVEDEDEESVSFSKRIKGYRKEKASRSPVKRTRKNTKSKVSRRKKPTVPKNKKEKKSRKKRGRGRKRNSPKEPATKRRRRSGQIKDDDFIVDDDDFIVEDRVEAKKKNNKRKPVSDSDTSEFEFITSDEDEFVIQEQIEPKKRRKNNICCSESGSGSDSSDSDYVIYEEEEVAKEMRKRKREHVKGKAKEGEKEEDTGKKMCGICLSEEQRRTTRGVLDCCAHFFCFACIVEWSKVESRCPVCKRRFETITKASSSDSDDLGFGAPRKVIKVPKRDQVYQPSEEDIRGMLDPYENVLCMECQQGGDDNLMLLCDICDSSAHTYCVGLGNAVPEGNWYCDCCRSAGVGPSNLPPQPSMGPADPAPTELDLFANLQPTAPSFSPLEIDLNAPPRDVLEDPGVGPSQVASPSAGGAATLSGRRAIRNRIRILLSNTRPMQVVRRNGEERNGVGLGLRVGGSVGQQRSFLAPQRERGGPHDVDRAKEQVRSMVKNHLKQICSNAPLDRDAFKDVARRATYTVLAACGFGVEHNRHLVFNSISAPIGCSHETRDSEQTSLLAGSCSACFDFFVRDVAVTILNRG
ncbi:RING/U-box protein [Carex rostrata]